MWTQWLLQVATPMQWTVATGWALMLGAVLDQAVQQQDKPQ